MNFMYDMLMKDGTQAYVLDFMEELLPFSKIFTQMAINSTLFHVPQTLVLQPHLDIRGHITNNFVDCRKSIHQVLCVFLHELAKKTTIGGACRFI